MKAFLKNWFTSYFGIVTTILLANAIAAQQSFSQVWKIVAWSVFLGHLFGFAGMCLFVWIVFGPTLSLIVKIKK